MTCRCLLRGSKNMSIDIETNDIEESGSVDESIIKHISEKA